MHENYNKQQYYFLLLDNIGLAALLETRETAWDNGMPTENPPLLVCTAHIHWDPEFCDVKLVQTMMLMHELRLIAEESEFGGPGASPADKVHLIFCGDMNSLPESGLLANNFDENNQLFQTTIY